MPDRFIEDLAQTLRLERTKPGLGHDRPHAATPRAPPPRAGAEHVGLDRSGVEQLLRAVGALLLDIREHVHATTPRAEDKDFSVLKQAINGDKKSDPPLGRLTLDAAGGANEAAEVRIQMTEGFTGHVAGIRVRSTDPQADAASLSVTLTLRGTTLALPRVRFARPHVLELNDELRITVRNLAATPQTVDYAVEGWLRREA